MFSSLSKQVWHHKTLAITGLTSLLYGTCASPALARTYTFVFGNYTEQEIVELYWRPAAVEEGGWGSDFLSVRGPLLVNELVRFEIDDDAPPLNSIDPNNEDITYPDDCSFDIRGVLSNGEELEEYGINLCETSEVIGFFDFIDDEAFYEEGGKEIFITNDTNLSLVELVFEDQNSEQYFVFGDVFKNTLRTQLGELPTLPTGETDLFLVNLPESECEYEVTPTFLNMVTGQSFETATRSIDFCLDYNEITVSENSISLQGFERRSITVANNTPYRLVTLEVAPSFRPELWSSVIQSDFIAPHTETTDLASAIQLTSNDEQARCLFDIHGVLVNNSASGSEQVSVTQYFVDLCETEGMLTFRPGIILD